MKRSVIFLLIPLVAITSCASPELKKEKKPKEPLVSAEVMVIQEASREAVFVYGKTEQKKIIKLMLTGEPVLFPSGYVRLVGVVSGGRPTACLEIGGRGLALTEGEKIDDYRVGRVYPDHVVLERRP